MGVFGFFLNIIFAFLIIQTSVAQGDIFNVIFQQNFEATSLGAYDREQWKSDWNRPDWENGLSRTEILDVHGDHAMKFNYPEGSVSPMDGGAQWLSNFGPGHEEVYFSFNVMFRPGFEWVLGGKLPGLGGGSNPAGGKTVEWDDGFSVRIMWNKEEGSEGTCFFYVYHQDKTSEYGDVFQFPDGSLDVSDSVWHNMTIRLVLNSIDQTKLVSDPQNAGNKDGLMEFFLDGRLVFSKTGMWFRNLGNIWIDTQHITSFFGGNTEEWAAQRNEWTLFDDFTVFTYNEKANVPRGQMASPTNRLLELPNLKVAAADPDDIEAPSIPVELEVTEVTGFSIGLEWEPSVDNEYVKGYRIFLDDEEQGTSVYNRYMIVGLEANSTYNVAVSAFDASSNESAQSEKIEVTTANPDLEPPSIPTNLKVIDSTDHSLLITWDRSTDNIRVKGYNIYLNGNYEGTTVNTVYSILQLKSDTDYEISVSAFDESSNESPLTVPTTAHTKVSDISPPSVPNGLTATVVTQTSAGLIWDASVDNVSVSGYNIYVNGLRKGISTTNSFTLKDLTPGLDYGIRVSAFDGSSNESLPSAEIQVTTDNPDETNLPKLPEINLVNVTNKASIAETVAKISSYGNVLIEDYGILVEQTKQSTHSEDVVFAIPGATSLNHQGRIDQGLQLMYDFSNGAGKEISDVSDTGIPVDLFINDQNAAAWLPGQGLRVLENTRIRSEGNCSEFARSLASSNEFTLEAWIKPPDNQSSVAPIISLADGSNHKTASMRHVGNHSSFEYSMVLSNEMNSFDNHEVVTDNKFISLELQHLVYTRDRHGIEKFYVNGTEMCSGYYDGDLTNIGDDVHLVLSEGMPGEEPWYGTYYLVAVYSEALDQEKVLKNFLAGYGEIQFRTEFELMPDVQYSISPFVRTDQGIVFGASESLLAEDLLLPEPDDSIYMSVYPNPSDGNFQIQLNLSDNSEGKPIVQVSDLKGNVVYFEEIQLTDNEKIIKKELSLSSLIHSGVYTVQLIFRGRSYARRLIIQR